MDALMSTLMERCASRVVKTPPAALEAAQILAEQRYRTWDWNYGTSPAFTEQRRERFPWGLVEYRLEVRKGHIVSCRIFGDFFSQRDTHELEQRIQGRRFAEETVQAALVGVAWEEYFSGCDAATMYEFFCRS